MLDKFLMIVLGVSTMLIGNCAGDTKTLRQCATTGTTELFGGGTIKCEVIKSTKDGNVK